MLQNLVIIGEEIKKEWKKRRGKQIETENVEEQMP